MEKTAIPVSSPVSTVEYLELQANQSEWTVTKNTITFKFTTSCVEPPALTLHELRQVISEGSDVMVTHTAVETRTVRRRYPLQK